MSNVVLCSVYAVLYLHNYHGDRAKETSICATGQAWSSDMVIAVREYTTARTWDLATEDV